MQIRPRRLRNSGLMREMVAETRLSKEMFVYPVFVMKGNAIKHEIGAMPGIYHFSPDTLCEEVRECLALGISRFLIFGVGETKDEVGSSCFDHANAVATAVRALRADFGNSIMIITDVCMCAIPATGIVAFTRSRS
ncbi:MAG: porphobilinogen synthase, partial [Bacteroidetes bacterium]|nr:porphobilinogen synthase [Bacteroidota bacterium]